MKLNYIITLASRGVQLPFNAMERSLRSVGCDLPLRVIPFNEDRFTLPANAEWWVVPELREWIDQCPASARAKGVMHKYQTLLIGNYLFVDSDVIFLRDPREVYAAPTGFITSCGHWHDPSHTVTSSTRAWMQKQSTIWQSSVFNSGQFACDRPLYDFETLRAQAESEELKETCLGNPFHEQPGMNALVFASRVPVTNLCLPPHRFESSWAGDYIEANYAEYWTNLSRKPCFLHWAGRKPNGESPVDELFLQHLNEDEKHQWNAACQKTQESSFDQLKRISRKYRGLFTV